MLETKLYKIQIKVPIGGPRLFRFRSLVNGSTGPWSDYEKLAIEDGELHAEIMCEIYPSIRKFHSWPSLQDA